MKIVLAAAVVLVLAACSSSAKNSSTTTVPAPAATNTTTTLSAAEIAANEHAVHDVVISSCAPDGSNKLVIKGTVRNPTHDPANYVVQLAISDKSGKRLYGTAASATGVDPGRTKSWEAVTTADFASGMTCKVSSVSVHATG